jgi:putative SOS response-associated peptidase YedK
MTIAAIQDAWNDPQSGERIRSCAMVVTEPNKFVAEVHDRMPVILEAQDFERWEQGDANDAAGLMKPAPEDILEKWSVSKRVNSSRAGDEDARLIERIEVTAKARSAIL